MQYGQKQAWQTKAIGLVAVIAVNVLAGWALVSGLAQRVTAAVINEVEAVVIEETPPPPDTPPPPPPELDVPPPPRVEMPIVRFESAPASTAAITAEVGPPEPEPVVVPAGPTRGPMRIVRRGDELPPFPEASLRLEETGETTVRVCADIEGRPTSVETVQSSGSSRLDRAAEQWLRRSRYEPALENGQPVAGCTNTIVEWVLPEF